MLEKQRIEILTKKILTTLGLYSPRVVSCGQESIKRDATASLAITGAAKVAKDLDELRSLRPGNRSAIDSHKKRMLEETVAYRLRELRERNGLSQVQLADLMQVS